MSLAGRTLGRYRVSHEIGRGGMGVVYRATDTTLGREVALKLLPPDKAQDADLRRRFVREAQAAAALEHPHIATVHDAGESDGHAYIAMELLRGHSLADELAKRPLPLARAVDVAVQVAAALARAHEAGIVHRDLKPSNVMITDEGHAKVIDFGVAKVNDAGERAGDHAETYLSTSAGAVVGTTAYLSPEQARGEAVDGRSDIFALGVLMHEMATGQSPFRRATAIETTAAILHDPLPRLAVPDSVPGDVVAEWQRAVDKCTAKDPSERYQAVREVAVDLRALARRLALPGGSATTVEDRPRRWRPTGVTVLVALGVLVALLAAVRWLRVDWTSRTTPGETAAATPSKPRVAVLYFDNTSADTELAWLRTGLPEMLVTDLSQSSAIEVVGTDRLYDVVSRLGAVDAPTWSAEVVRGVASATGVDTLVLGSYLRVGDTLRITARLQEAASGRVLTSARVDGPSSASLFGMVDDLAGRIRRQLEGAPAAASAGAPASLSRGLGDITTASIDAYREYAEGIQLHERNREEEAAVQFERAVTRDPDFAMAYAKLAVVQGNLGRDDLLRQYAEMALARAARLTDVDRAYIEGVYFSHSPATIDRGLQAYARCVSLDAGHQACRNNIANSLVSLERYAEALPHLDDLLRRGSTLSTAIGLRIQALSALGETDRAVAAAEEYTREAPDVAVAHVYLARALIVAGRFAEATAVIDRAEKRGYRHFAFAPARVAAAAHGGDLAAAERGADAMAAASIPAARWYGALWQGHLAVLRGQCDDVRSASDRAIGAFAVPGLRRAFARQLTVSLHETCGRAPLALAEARRAVDDARGTELQASTTGTLAVMFARAGRQDEALATLATMPEAATPEAVARRTRERAFALGRISLALGNVADAVPELMAAAAALSPRSGDPLGVTDHVAIWFSVGEALYLAGRPSEARPWLAKVAAGPFEIQGHPADYVRSHFYLGKIAAATGDAAAARASFERFLNHWQGGAIDPARVAEAKRAVAASLQ